MKGKAEKQFPHAEEWDFRQIDDVTLPFVILYEYARSTTGLKSRVLEWLDGKKIGGRTVRSHLRSACEEYSKDSKTSIIDNVPVNVRCEIWQKAMTAELPYALTELIASSRPDFPQPWLRFPLKFGKNPMFSRVLCIPLARTIKRLKENHELFAVYEREESSLGTNYHLRIDWAGSSAKEISDHLERWVRREAKKRTDLLRGAPAQSQCVRLKDLAALRIAEAGLTFGTAQDFLRPHNDGGRLIPLYDKNRGGWSRALKRAKQELARIESLGVYEM